jgi:hypothetical protein
MAQPMNLRSNKIIGKVGTATTSPEELLKSFN